MVYSKRQIEELAVAVAALVSGGNSGSAAQSVIAALVPQSIGHDIAKVKEWFTNNPYGTNQMEFAKRMAETAEREKFLAQQKIRMIKSELTSAVPDLAKRNPEKWANLQARHFGEGAQFDKNGSYVMQPVPIVHEPHDGDSSTAYAAPANIYSAGETRTINDIPYTRDGKGNWNADN